MISAILHVLVTKFIEIGRTPGVTAKLNALVVGKYPASSIAGIVAAVALVAGAAVAERLGWNAPDWQVVTGLAVALIVGGRGARSRRKAKASPAPGAMPAAGAATMRSRCCRAPLALTGRGWLCTKCHSLSSFDLPASPLPATPEDVDRSGSTSPTGGAGDLSKRETKKMEFLPQENAKNTERAKT